MVGVSTSSSGPGWCGRFAPHRKQIRSSGWTLTPQSGQLRLAMFSLSCLGSQPPLDYRRRDRFALLLGGTTPRSPPLLGGPIPPDPPWGASGPQSMPAPPACEGSPMVSYQLAPEQQDL